MKEAANGFEFLEQLRQQNGKQFQNYQDLARYLDVKARKKNIPIHGQFELTPLCNFSCKMCYVHLDPDQLNGRRVLPADTWKGLTSQARDAGMLHATLTGGECLTYPGFEDVYLYLHSIGCDVSILTNGFLLDDKRIRFFKEHMPQRIQITLYGQNDDVYERITGVRAFSTVVENARKAVEAGLPVTMNVTPSTFLGEDVLETIRTAKSIRSTCTVNAALFTPREETGRSDQHATSETELYTRIYRMLNEMNGNEIRTIDPAELPPTGGPYHECQECGLHCGGGRSSFVMNWKGTMMACNRLDMIRGDALKDGFGKAWSRVNEMANNWPRVPECEECPYVRICNNCAGNMLRFTEPGKLPRELCEQTKQYVCQGVRPAPECE